MKQLFAICFYSILLLQPLQGLAQSSGKSFPNGLQPYAFLQLAVEAPITPNCPNFLQRSAKPLACNLGIGLRTPIGLGLGISGNFAFASEYFAYGHSMRDFAGISMHTSMTFGKIMLLGELGRSWV